MSLSREKIEYGSIRNMFSQRRHQRYRQVLKRGINRRIRHTAKKIDEDSVAEGTNKYVEIVKKYADEEKSEVVVICGKFDADLAEIEDPQDKKDFMESVGLKESGLAVLARKAYHLMGLRTFFTGGPDECRAWTIHSGDKAPRAAGVIHTDFEKGFIRAEAYTIEDLRQYGDEAAIKAAGKYRQEGKEYVVQDGDVLFFKFNV